MTQHVIDVDGVPTLFSPVLAHSLEPGDLFTLTDPGSYPWRVYYIERESRDVLWIGVTAPGTGGSEFGYEVMFNQSVLRAVGARAARGGAR
jgi:hypothetical protein